MNVTPPLHAPPTSGARERAPLDARPLSPEPQQQRDRLLWAVVRGVSWLGLCSGLVVIGLGLFHPQAGAPGYRYLGALMVVSSLANAFGLSRRWAPWLIFASLLLLVLTIQSFRSVF